MIKNSKSCLAFLLLLLGFIGIQRANYAQERTYERGFYARLQTGGGQGFFELKHLSETNTIFTSTSPFISFQMGSVIAPNFILHAGISSVQAVRANSGVQNHTSSSYRYTILSAGLSYYFMPYNIYVSPELRIFGDASLAYEDSMGTETEKIFDSGTGYGLSIGKEWGLDDAWNLGLAFTSYQDSFRGDRTREINNNTVEGRNNFDDARNLFIGFALSLSYHKF